MINIRKLLEENGLPSSDLTEGPVPLFLVIRNIDKLLACAGTEIYPPFALLRSLAVRPEFRKRGFGAELLTAIENLLISKGVQSVYLLTTTAEDYFAGKGYILSNRNIVPSTISATNEFRSLCPASAVCMVKHLGK
jgi:amino-acid N-acetyltransferase